MIEIVTEAAITHRAWHGEELAERFHIWMCILSRSVKNIQDQDMVVIGW